MLKNIRISQVEAEKINEWANVNNKILKDVCGTELLDSEVVHLLISIALDRLKVDKSGKVYFV